MGGTELGVCIQQRIAKYMSLGCLGGSLRRFHNAAVVFILSSGKWGSPSPVLSLILITGCTFGNTYPNRSGTSLNTIVLIVQTKLYLCFIFENKTLKSVSSSIFWCTFSYTIGTSLLLFWASPPFPSLRMQMPYRGQRPTLGIFLNLSPPHILESASFAEPGTCQVSETNCPAATETLLSLLLQHWT